MHPFSFVVGVSLCWVLNPITANQYTLICVGFVLGDMTYKSFKRYLDKRASKHTGE